MATGFPHNFRTYGAVSGSNENLIPTNNSYHHSDSEPVENGHTGSSCHLVKIADAGDGEDEDMTELAFIKKQAKDCCSQTFTVKNLLKIFPIVKWLPKYRLGTLQCDFIAGLTVGLTAIPQGLAYAQVANLPPQYGLYTAFMGSFVYCILGTAKDVTLGPTAIMGLLTAAFATDLSPELKNGEKDPTMAILLTFMSGVIQLGMGILRLGILVNFISHPIINAFTSAAAITIAFGQVKNILGLKKISSDFLPMVYDTFSKIPETRVWDLTMGLVSLVAVFTLKLLRSKKWKDDPGATPPKLVAFCRKIIWFVGIGGNALVVISASGVAAALESQGIGDAVSVTGHIEAGMPPFQPPRFEIHGDNFTWSSSDIFSKIGSGLALVPLLSIVEAMAVAKALARINNYKIDPTQELVALGVSNILGSFVSSYTVTGSFTRSAVNNQSGVRTPLGGIFTGGLVILALCVLTPWFYYIPKSALAAVIIVAVLQMVDYHIVLTLWRQSKLDLIPFSVTFICSLIVGIEYGILIGIGLSLVFVLYPIARPSIKYTQVEHTLIITPAQGLNFPGSEYLEAEVFERAVQVGKPCNVVLNMEHISDLDYTAVQSVKALSADCSLHEIKLIVANGTPRVKRLLTAGNIKELMIYNSIQEALDRFNPHENSMEH